MPSGLKLAEWTDLLTFVFEGLGEGLAAARVPHPRRIVEEAVTTRVPSGLKLAEQTHASCLRGSVRGWPLRASHTRAVLSGEAVTTRVPSGLKLAEKTSFVFEGLGEGLAAARVPHPRRIVVRSGDDAGAVGTETR